MTAESGNLFIDLVGKEHVRQEAGELEAYFRSGSAIEGISAVRPGSTEEVQKVLARAHRERIPVYTINDGALNPEGIVAPGIILDCSRLNRIEKLDPRNLTVRVERGVTWEAMERACAEAGVRMATPLAASSESVLANYVGRNPVKRINRMSEMHVSTLQAVLPDGRLYKSGSHALSEDVGAEYPDDGGPSLSRWHYGADDIFGVVTRGSILLYPAVEDRDVLGFAFDDLAGAAEALRTLPRTELGVEYIAANSAYLDWLLDGELLDIPSWLVMVGFEGRKVFTSYQKEQVIKRMAALGGAPHEASHDAVLNIFDRVWRRGKNFYTEFYSSPGKFPAFDNLITKAMKNYYVPIPEVGCMLAAVDRGRALWSAYDVFAKGILSSFKGFSDINLELARQGAFFNRPQGRLAEEIYSRTPQLKKHIRTIKGLLDPHFILNPGHIVKVEDPALNLTPAPAAGEEPGLTVANLARLQTELKEVVGGEWVSDNPADLNAYARDFTIFSGERPNLVVLPASTAEVREVVKLAVQYGIPVVPLTTGFNHGGLTIPRKGGLLVDLKRMNRLIKIDEENMLATIEPGVRHRVLYREAMKVKTVEGLGLKPILSGTMGSISVLSNYVSRGGAMTAVKYGSNVELTVNMTWVLPNGEILKLGPSAFPEVGELGLTFGMGPDMGGMFFNADGAFGICTELTLKLYPAMPEEELMISGSFEAGALQPTINAIYDLSQGNLAEFIYKSHAGTMVITMAGLMEGMNPQSFFDMMPEHVLVLALTALDQEELNIRRALVEEILAQQGLLIIDPAAFGPELAGLINPDVLHEGMGIKGNTLGSFRGAFQWTAGYFHIDQLPGMLNEYEKLVAKYWKSSDPTIPTKHAYTGSAIQGPLPYCRSGAIEFDFWWDQGNPEQVKRAAKMLARTTELLFRHGGIPIRNMFGFGEMLIPRLGVYTEVLKTVRRTYDPLNLMHPDVLPVTDDYV